MAGVILKTESAQAVAVAGTAEALVGSDTLATSVVIQAQKDNTGDMYIGDSTVDSTNGIELQPGQSLTVEGEWIGGTQESFNLADIWVDAATSGDEVRIIYVKRNN